MSLWLINIIVGCIMKYGEIEEKGETIGYRWGNWTLIDNMDPCYVHLLWKDKSIFDM